jgi:hypothetical protein
MAGGQHGAVQRGKGVGVLLDEFAAGAERAAGVAVPEFLGEDVDEADLLVHRALVERVRAQEAVDVAGAQVGHHFRRRHHADLHVGVGVQAGLGQVVAQQEVVHAVLERHGELEALPASWGRACPCACCAA